MRLSFENSSKQNKKLIESSYVEDLYDVIEDFFDEHKYRPHLLKFELDEFVCRITFESGCEGFVIEGITASEIAELKQLLLGD